MIGKRLLETLAMLMIGDSVLALLSPSRHVSLWTSGPGWWEKSVQPLLDHPRVTRLLGSVGFCLGVWLAWKQEPQAPTTRHHKSSHDGRHWSSRLAEAMQ